jgi:hypothetical protein
MEIFIREYAGSPCRPIRESSNSLGGSGCGADRRSQDKGAVQGR